MTLTGGFCLLDRPLYRVRGNMQKKLRTMSVALALSFSLAACTSAEELAKKEREREQAREIRQAEASRASLEEEVGLLQRRHERAVRICENGAPRRDPDGELELAEVDVAMADSIDSVSPEQEQRIRASIGAEMGLAPSQVNGWRSIYEGRARRARGLLEQAEAAEKREQDRACAEAPDLAEQLTSKTGELVAVRERLSALGTDN